MHSMRMMAIAVITCGCICGVYADEQAAEGSKKSAAADREVTWPAQEVIAERLEFHDIAWRLRDELPSRLAGKTMPTREGVRNIDDAIIACTQPDEWTDPLTAQCARMVLEYWRLDVWKVILGNASAVLQEVERIYQGAPSVTAKLEGNEKE